MKYMLKDLNTFSYYESVIKHVLTSIQQTFKTYFSENINIRLRVHPHMQLYPS